MVDLIEGVDESILKQVIKIIDSGGVVCFPTETVYALAADASNSKAVDRIYDIKGRNSSKPLSVLVGDIYQAKRIVHFNERAQKLALRFFPGPLTMVLNTKPHHNLAPNINREIGTVGIRMPSHALSLKILKASGKAIVGTSANLSGGSVVNAANPKNVIKAIGDKIDIMVDQGETELGIDSTIVDLSTDETKLLRVGAISEEEIKRTLGLT
jgi:L-threonylcarbamoyladenylate synthase